MHQVINGRGFLNAEYVCALSSRVYSCVITASQGHYQSKDEQNH